MATNNNRRPDKFFPIPPPSRDLSTNASRSPEVQNLSKVIPVRLSEKTTIEEDDEDTNNGITQNSRSEIFQTKPRLIPILRNNSRFKHLSTLEVSRIDNNYFLSQGDAGGFPNNNIYQKQNSSEKQRRETQRAVCEFLEASGGRLACSEGSKHTPDLYRLVPGFEPVDFQQARQDACNNRHLPLNDPIRNQPNPYTAQFKNIPRFASIPQPPIPKPQQQQIQHAVLNTHNSNNITHSISSPVVLQNNNNLVNNNPIVANYNNNHLPNITQNNNNNIQIPEFQNIQSTNTNFEDNTMNVKNLRPKKDSKKPSLIKDKNILSMEILPEENNKKEKKSSSSSKSKTTTTSSSSSCSNLKSKNVLVDYLKHRTCYDLVPTSSKLVVFDTGLVVKKAFFALVANGLRAAPLWSSQAQRFVGMLTITDFIMILVKFYKTGDTANKMKEIEEYTIQAWRELMGKQYSSFVSIDAECSLYDGLQQLIKYKIHRLPIMDFNTGNPLYILTHKRILKFIKVCIDSQNDGENNSNNSHKTENNTKQDKSSKKRPEKDEKSKTSSKKEKSPKKTEKSSSSPETEVNSWKSIPIFQRVLGDVKLGTYHNIAMMYEDQPLIKALEVFSHKRVSALPIIQRGTDKLVNVYSKFDVINLAAERSYNNLNITISEALQYRTRQGRPERKMIICKLHETIEEIANKVVKAEVHRIIVVDDGFRVIGIVSLSDLLAYMVRE